MIQVVIINDVMMGSDLFKAFTPNDLIWLYFIATVAFQLNDYRLLIAEYGEIREPLVREAIRVVVDDQELAPVIRFDPLDTLLLKIGFSHRLIEEIVFVVFGIIFDFCIVKLFIIDFDLNIRWIEVSKMPVELAVRFAVLVTTFLLVNISDE